MPENKPTANRPKGDSTKDSKNILIGYGKIDVFGAPLFAYIDTDKKILAGGTDGKFDITDLSFLKDFKDNDFLKNTKAFAYVEHSWEEKNKYSKVIFKVEKSNHDVFKTQLGIPLDGFAIKELSIGFLSGEDVTDQMKEDFRNQLLHDGAKINKLLSNGDSEENESAATTDTE